MKTFYAFLLLVSASFLHGSECTRRGQSMAVDGWKAESRRVCLGDGVDSNFFASPDGRKMLIADLHGFHLKVDGVLIRWPDGLNLVTSESEVQWAPTSSAFFINDGVGLDGWKLKVYVLSGVTLTSHEDLHKEIVGRYRSAVKCSSKAWDPNVKGLGWSEDGSLIFAFAQATVNERCGQSAEFRGATIDLAGDQVLAFYSESKAKEQFHKLLPYNMR